LTNAAPAWHQKLVLELGKPLRTDMMPASDLWQTLTLTSVSQESPASEGYERPVFLGIRDPVARSRVPLPVVLEASGGY
jgi:hypothetical protein